MRHKNKRLQLNRFTSWRKATLISLARNLLAQESIKTTLTKAKAVRPLAETLISLSKANSLAAKRRAYQILGDHKLVSRLFNEIGPRFTSRTSGYTRIIQLGNRRGDNAKIAILELLERKIKEVKKPKKEKEVKPEEERKPVVKEGKPIEEKKPPITKKPTKNFLGGLRSIFKKERDAL
jgi:large subunit ribosomal protein L17